MTKEFLEGSRAIAEAMVNADCKFFAGYPMTPFTEVLEEMGRMLPEAGGVCINAESEIEAIGMVWGAAAAGRRAATGSVGQGLALMQESIAELCLARLPAVILNMARGQGDYFQATRGGGHGDYNVPVLAPCDLAEAVRVIQLAFHLADQWRNPVMFMGDFYLAHVFESVDTAPIDFGALEPKSWALDGSTSGRGDAKIISPIITTKRNAERTVRYGEYLNNMGTHFGAMRDGIEPMAETCYVEDAELVVVAYGTPGRIIRYVVDEMRNDGIKVGLVRPITLWPFPSEIVREATRSARALAVYELNNGQMYDDVRLAVGGFPVHFIGGVNHEPTGFGISPNLTPEKVRCRIEDALAALRVEVA